MQFNGDWYLCGDGIIRPIMRGEILADNGSWRAVEFLVDMVQIGRFSAPHMRQG